MSNKWIETTIGQYCPFVYGKSLPQAKREFGKYAVFGSNGIVDYHNDYCAQPFGVIIGRKGSVGEVHLSTKPFWVIDTAFYITNNDIDELRFIYYLLKTLKLKEMNSDSTVPGLNRNNAHSIKIKIPANATDMLLRVTNGQKKEYQSSKLVLLSQ